MPLPSSGAISLNQMHVEVGGTSGTQCSLNDSDIRGLINKASGAQSSFSQFHGASAATTILSGNSSYTAPSQYVAEQRNLMALTPHKSFVTIGPQPYMTATTFTLNGRSTYPAMFTYFPSTGGFALSLIDLTGGVRTTPSGAPLNSGWTKITITGGGNSTSFTRSSANYGTNVQVLFLNGGTTSSQYGGARWDWSSGTNILPASNNTTSFTLEIS